MRYLSAPTTIILLVAPFLTTPVLAQTQSVRIETICVDGSPVIGAACSLTIGQHQSRLVTPGATAVPKSLDDLLVSCLKDKAAASGQFSSRRNGGTWDKLAAWGGLDQVLNWGDLDELDYPKSMTVVLPGPCTR
jgi:hypothetical protein